MTQHVNINKASRGDGWQLRWTFAQKRYQLSVAGNEAQAKYAAQHVEQLVGFRLSHPTPATAGDLPAVTQWVRTLPKRRVETLHAYGLLDRSFLASSLEILALLDEYAGSLRDTRYGLSPARIDTIDQQVRHVLDRAKISTPRDLTRERLRAALVSLTVPGGKDGAEREISTNTRWAYGQAVSQFCRWMQVEKGLLTTNPAEGIIRHGKAERLKRPLRRAEQFALLSWVYTRGPVMTWTTGERQNTRVVTLTGPDRWAIYRTAIETGARLGTLTALTVADLSLDGERPHIRIRASITKAKLSANPPIGTGLADHLRAHVATRMPTAPVFDMPPNDGDAAEMLRRDLAGARAAWIMAAGNDAELAKTRNASDFLAEKDHHGHVAQFHSLRQTAILNLLRAGKTDTAIVIHVGHATIATTRAHYMRTGYLPSAIDAVEPMPDFDETAAPVALEATGTEHFTPRFTPNSDRSGPVVIGRDRSPTANIVAEESQDSSANPAYFADALRDTKSAPRRTRTFDPLIKSQLLYQLS